MASFTPAREQMDHKRDTSRFISDIQTCMRCPADHWCSKNRLHTVITAVLFKIYILVTRYSSSRQWIQFVVITTSISVYLPARSPRNISLTKTTTMSRVHRVLSCAVIVAKHTRKHRRFHCKRNVVKCLPDLLSRCFEPLDHNP